MANLTQKKKHQQFGLKLLIVALLIGAIFSAWYFSEKTEKGDKKIVEMADSNRISIPGDDLRDMKDIYTKQARKLVPGTYNEVQLAATFQFFNYTDNPELKSLDRENFWNKFEETFLDIDPKQATFTTYGNQVIVKFQADYRNPSKDAAKTAYFVRKLSFGDYDKTNRSQTSNAVLLQDAVLSDTTTAAKHPSLQIGDKLPGWQAKGIVDGQVVTTDISAKKGRWKLLFFFPNAFSYICPTECVALMENSKKLDDLNVDIYAISGDLPATLQAWESKYFGNLPYTLVSDPELKGADQFGFKNIAEGVAYRGTVIVDPTNTIRYTAAQDNNVGRDVESYLTMFTALQTPGLKPVNWQPGEAVILP